MASIHDIERCDTCSEALEQGRIGKCDDCGPVPGGWFEVDVYQTAESWQSPTRATETESPFSDLAEAISFAKSDFFDDAYQVTVTARGEHEAHEPGERVFSRNILPIA